MRRTLKITLVGLLLAATAIAATSMVYVSNANAQSSYGGNGPWTIVPDGGSGGYLLNTTTGETWRLRDEIKVAVHEWKPEPKK